MKWDIINLQSQHKFDTESWKGTHLKNPELNTLKADLIKRTTFRIEFDPQTLQSYETVLAFIVLTERNNTDISQTSKNKSISENSKSIPESCEIEVLQSHWKIKASWKKNLIAPNIKIDFCY